jgi:hypothetical protein
MDHRRSLLQRRQRPSSRRCEHQTVGVDRCSHRDSARTLTSAENCQNVGVAPPLLFSNYQAQNF